MKNTFRLRSALESYRNVPALLGMPTDVLLNNLFDEYLPFRLYADHKGGSTVNELAKEFSLPASWVAERIEAARLCIEMQVRLELPFPAKRTPRKTAAEAVEQSA